MKPDAVLNEVTLVLAAHPHLRPSGIEALTGLSRGQVRLALVKLDLAHHLEIDKVDCRHVFYTYLPDAKPRGSIATAPYAEGYRWSTGRLYACAAYQSIRLTSVPVPAPSRRKFKERSL